MTDDASSPECAAGPVRVQLRRSKGWRMPENTVSVARPGRWGNPFRILNEEGWPLITRADGSGCFNKREYGPDAVPEGEGTCWHNVHTHAVALFRERAVDGLPSLAPLRGKNLACWCGLCDAHKDGKPFGVECADCAPCHADVLLELVNAPNPQEHLARRGR